jgi:hypothetical protein
MTLEHISITARNAGANTNSASFNIFTCTAANWELDTLTSDSQTVTLTSSANNSPTSAKYVFSPRISISQGDLFGVQMSVPTLGAMNGLAFAITCQES